MAASRTDIPPSVDHLNYFAKFTRYNLLNREGIVRRFKELFSLPTPERKQLEINLYQDIQYAALYLMFIATRNVNIDLKLIWPTRPMPKAITYRCNQDELITNLEENISLKKLDEDMQALSLVTLAESLKQYIYLYKEMHCIYKYIETLLLYFNGDVKRTALQKCVDDNVVTLRETLDVEKRIISTRYHSEKNNKKETPKKTQAQTQFELPPNVYIEWFYHEQFLKDGSDDIANMTTEQRADIKFATLFLQRLLDEVFSNKLSKMDTKLAEILKRDDIIKGYLVANEDHTDFTIGLETGTPEKVAQEIKLKRLLKLDVVATSLGKMLHMKNHEQSVKQLMTVFQNTNQLFTFFEQELEQYMHVDENGKVSFVQVPTDLVNNEKENAALFRSLTINVKYHLDDDIVKMMWALHTKAVVTPKSDKKNKPQKPRTPSKLAIDTFIPPTQSKHENLDIESEDESTDDESPEDKPPQKDEKVPTPEEVISFSVKRKYEELRTNVVSTCEECKSLKLEYRKLYREHSDNISNEKLSDWAKRVEQIDKSIEELNDKICHFQMPAILHELQDALIAYNHLKDKITSVSTQIKNLKREFNKEVAALPSQRAETLFIQQKLAEKRASRNGKTPPLNPASPARSPAPIQSPTFGAQARRTSVAGFSLFESPIRGNAQPQVPAENTVQTPRSRQG